MQIFNLGNITTGTRPTTRIAWIDQVVLLFIVLIECFWRNIRALQYGTLVSTLSYRNIIPLQDLYLFFTLVLYIPIRPMISRCHK